MRGCRLVLPDKILVVDDEPDILNLIKIRLAMRKFQVVTASNGEEALRNVQTEMPDLILLDVMMPCKSGLDVCKILKSQNNTRHIPIVICTALDRDVDRRMAAEAGSDGLIDQTFSGETLVAEVIKQLDDVRGKKFSQQLGLQHGELAGRRFLLEFDPSAPYERLVRDFACECVAHNEAVTVLTKRGSTVLEALEDIEQVELVDVTPDLMLSHFSEKSREKSLSFVYDSLTDLIFSIGAEATYKFAQNTAQLLAGQRITAVFLLNPAAHDQKDAYSLRGLFSNQITYGKEGTTNIRIA